MPVAYPLSWPVGWRRTPTAERKRAQFGRSERQQVGESSWLRKRELTIYQAAERVFHELRLLGVNRNQVVLSTDLKLRQDGLPRSDQREPADPGAAVYWTTVKGKHQTIAIDRYDRVADNLGAIAATLEAMRAIERHGGAQILERAFIGFNALPAMGQTAQPWREVLQLGRDAVSLDAVEARFRELAHKHHPDRGGDPEKFRRLIEARDQARRELEMGGAA